MQTIQLQVKDGYTQNVLRMLESVKGIMIERIEVQKDQNFEFDPYFYERREELQKLADAVERNEMPMYDFNESMNELIAELENLK